MRSVGVTVVVAGMVAVPAARATTTTRRINTSFFLLVLLTTIIFRTATATTFPIVVRGGGRDPVKGRHRTAATKTTTPISSCPLLLHDFLQTIRNAKRHLASAAIARSTSIFAMYPVDTIKTRVQTGQTNALRITGLYQGVWGSLAGQVPYGVLTFGSYEIYKEKLQRAFPQTRPAFLVALAAVCGDLTGSGLLCPSEVVKQKLQAGIFASTREAIAGIWSKRGIQGFYEGYFGALTRDVPFRVAQLTTYELTKSIYLSIKQQKQQQQKKKKKKTAPSDETLSLTSIEAATCGALAGTFSAAITTPLDRIKTLMMTDSAAYGGNVLSCTAKILRDEGMAGLTKGLVPRVTYIAPSVIIFFIAYEKAQQRFRNW